VAVFRVTGYSKSPKAIKGHVKYMQHRSEKGRKVVRELYGNDGVVEREEVYNMFDEAMPGSQFCKIVMSPDPENEDTRKDLHLRDIAEKTMQVIQEQFTIPILWVAADHTQQTDKRHIHVVAIVPEKLNKQDLALARGAATEASITQRKEHDVLLAQKQREKEKQWEQELSY
jgi:hypothetical protein